MAARNGVAVRTLYMIARGHKLPGARLCSRLEMYTNGTVKREDLRPDIFLNARSAALKPPEGYVLVPVEDQRDAKRFRWLKTCSREQYLLARGIFGLAEDVIDAVIQSEEKEATNGQ
jgi:hypothetical protein